MENFVMEEQLVPQAEKEPINLKWVLNKVLPFVSIAAFILLWLYASSVNSKLVPTPAMAWDRLLELFSTPVGNENLFGHIWASLKRVFTALSIAMVLGISIGVMIGWNKTFRATVGTLFEILRPIPPLAWLPVIIMGFGIGELPKIIIVFIGAFMPIVINSYTGIRLVEPLHIDVANSFNANNRQILFEVAIPSALPAIFAGIRNATSGAWMTVLAAEMIASKVGLGFLIQRGMDYFDVPLILVGMLTIGIVGAMLAVLTGWIERLIIPWNQKLNQD